MSGFRRLIEAEAKNVRGLHEAVHATSKRRGESQTALDEWHNACRRFHQHVSPIQDWIRHLDKGGFSENPDLRDFAITYLEIDPMYFRPGYIKARLLHRLKSVDLKRDEADRLTAVLVDAVRRRGQREFRHYCRLAAVLQRPEVLEESIHLATSTDGRVSSRARMMLEHLQNANHPRR